ncbi:hypothetical protein HY640_03205 [Candidatus Woesearchaeota archaeon]|nr:hypothetical protein [Candidatus Woesearchaeota archaeon]
MKKGNIPEYYQEELSLTDSNREDLKNNAVIKFLSEKKGYLKDGLKYVTRYKYYVETLKDGRRIYLLRPTFLNKGIDFQVWLEKYDGNIDKRPSHKGIIEDLMSEFHHTISVTITRSNIPQVSDQWFLIALN